MKNEEQLLINYMYQQGYSEEEMYDERILSMVEFSIDFRIFKWKQEFKPLFDSLVEAFRSMAVNITKTIKSLAASMDRLNKDQCLLERQKSPHKLFNKEKQLPLFNQVDNRKPRHLVRKIIR